MGTKRLLYLAVLGLCGIFYIAYGKWLSWLVLVTALALPWFSLALSLPAMVRFRASAAGPAVLNMGESGEFWLLGSCGFPMPLFRGRIRLKRLLTGDSWLYQEPRDLPTDHCGGLTLTLEGIRVYDYLGLFSRKVRPPEPRTILIRPRPVPMTLDLDPSRYVPRRWKPKPGGGFAENHELRPYRPGDSLNQVHWKLSAKAGQLILREAMEPEQGMILLTLNLRGKPEELDRKLGRLLWLGKKLLDQDLEFELQVLTGDGVLTWTVAEDDRLHRAVDDLLCRSAAGEGDLRTQGFAAPWHCHIGGQADEA